MAKTIRREAAARSAVANWLRAHPGTEAPMLFTISCVADQGHRDAGGTGELFSSLYSYKDLLPAGASTMWVQQHSGSYLAALNPHFRGPRTVQRADNPND